VEQEGRKLDLADAMCLGLLRGRKGCSPRHTGSNTPRLP